MRTATVAASLTRKGGGLYESLLGLNHELARLPNLDVVALGLEESDAREDLSRWAPVQASTFPVFGPRAIGYSTGLKQALSGSDFDVLHTHGLWQYPSGAVHAWHARTRRPYVVSPHGMLDSWAIRNSSWKKRLALVLFERAHLRDAACLRALCEAESSAIRDFGLPNPICIIPNGVYLPDLSPIPNSEFRIPNLNGRKVLLYLGRIHPKKGLVNLLKAWAGIRNSKLETRNPGEWVLAIAGWDQGGHEKELRTLSAERGIENSVAFLGPRFGAEKAACYRNCDAFILPSVSEGLPMVLLEAWAYGKPVLMTPECNLAEGFAAQAAIRIEPNVESISRGLDDLFRTPTSALRVLGNNGRDLVAARFTWPKIAREMKAVYEWLVAGGPKPECVI
jgi:glycosyltransferase involved in cell wall biosynthesis